MGYLKGENVDQIRGEYRDTIENYINLITSCGILERELESPDAKKFCLYGLARRIANIRRCLIRFQDVFEMECLAEEIDDDIRFEQTAFLNFFLLSLAGGLDNVAWIINHEKDLNLPPLKISLTRNEITPHLPTNLKEKLVEFGQWIEYLKSFRDPAAHRIPPYVVPYVQYEDGSKCNDSYYVHDFYESRMVLLHPQVIIDAKTFAIICETAVEGLLGRKAIQ